MAHRQHVTGVIRHKSAVVLLVSCLPLISSCSEVSGGPMNGRVSDEGDGRPIEGAIVVLKWKASLSGVHGSRYPCYHAEIAKSDPDGRFVVPRWTVDTSRAPPGDWLRDVNVFRTSTIDKPIEIQIFKPGYSGDEQVSHDKSNVDLKMRAFNGTTIEWLQYMLVLSRHVLCEGGNEKTLPLLEAMHTDARKVASTPEEVKRAESLLVTIETLIYGNASALDRATKREVDKGKSRK